MKTWIVTACVAVVVVVADRYTSRYDNIDIDEVLRNDRALNNYVKCIVDNGPCTPEGRELKTDIPDALRTDCAKCSDKQKQIVRKAARYLIDERPEQWERIVGKYDPDRQYIDKFKKFLNSEQ